MEHWWDEMRWLRRHVAVAPFGVFAATMLLTLYREQWIWPGPAGWDRAAGLVDLGAVFYGMAAVAVERSIRFMFWAWEQHQKVRAQLRDEGRKLGQAQGLEQGREQATKESAAKIQELEAANRELQARISELESGSGVRRGRSNRTRAARRRLAV